MFKERVEEIAGFCWVWSRHHEETATEAGGVTWAACEFEVRYIVGEMGMAMAFEDEVLVVSVTEAVEEA